MQWYKLRFGWEIQPEHIITSPVVMFSIGAIINALTEVGDKILICQPVYYPFSKIVTANNRSLVVSELTETNGRYQFDFDDIESGIEKLSNYQSYFVIGSFESRKNLFITHFDLSFQHL
jgi:cystathionine beta-lyase